MMKILFLLSQLKKQGPNTQFLYLAEELLKHSVEITVLTFKNYDDDSSLALLFERYGVEVVSCSHLSRYGFMKALSKMSNSFDYVCSYGLESDFYNAFLTRSRRISFARNQLFYSYASVYGPIGYVFGALNYIFFKRMHVVFACSKSVQSYLQRFRLQSKCLSNTINIGVLNDLIGNNSDFEDSGESTIRETSDFARFKRVFITISSRLEGKNTEFLLKCFSKPKLQENALLVLGYMPKDQIEKFTSVSNIKFLGFKPNIYDYLKISDYFVSASYHEGLPNAVLEALYFGLPCLLSDIPEHLEILEKCPSTKVGYSFRNDSIESFEENLIKVIDMNIEECSAAACSLIKRQFNTVATAVEFLEVLNDGP